MRLSDFTTVTRARTVEEATNDPRVVIAQALGLLEGYSPPPRPVRLLGVRVAGLSAAQRATEVRDSRAQMALPV